MTRFRANTDDAYILTNVQNQESGDSDWVKYQVITKDKSRLFLHSDTTNSLLKVFKDTTRAHDIFNDGSIIATYILDGNANDLGGNYNGMWSGTEQYDTGVFGQAAKFDSSLSNTLKTSYEFLSRTNNVTDTTSVSGHYTTTFSAWMKITDGTDLVLYNTGDNNNGYGIGIRNLHPCVAVQGNNSFHKHYVNFVIQVNVWYHLCFVFNESDCSTKIYINGSCVENFIPAVAVGDRSAYIYIGSITDTSTFYDDSSTHYNNGLINQFRIFNRALTEDEVAFLYHEGLINIRKHDQLIIYNTADGAKVHEITSITDNDTDKTYDIDISSLSLTGAPTNVHQLTKSVDLTGKIDTLNTTATTLVLQDALENPTLVKNGETLVINGYKLGNINVTRSLDGGNIKYSVDISSLNLTQAPLEVILIKPRVEISVGNEDRANADDLVLDVLDSTTTSITVGCYENSKRARIKNAEKVDVDTGLDLSVIQVVEEYIDPTKIDPFNDNSELAFYPLDGNANDAHNQYNGTWNGTEQYDTGRFGQAAKFDGNSAIELPKEVRNGHTTFSISFWFCLEVDSEDTVSIYSESITTSDSPPNNGIKISAGCGDAGKEDKIVFSTQDGNYTIIADKPAILEYHHIVITSDGDGNYKAYFDGQFKSSIYDTDSMSDIQVVKVGSHYLGPDLYDLQGRIDNLRIFNRALTEKEIKYLYGEGKYKFNLNLQTEQSSSPTKTIIRPTIQDILELDPNNTTYDNTNDLVNMYYQPVQKGNGFRSVQVKWNAHKYGDKNSSLRINLWKKVV